MISELPEAPDVVYRYHINAGFGDGCDELWTTEYIRSDIYEALKTDYDELKFRMEGLEK